MNNKKIKYLEFTYWTAIINGILGVITTILLLIIFLGPASSYSSFDLLPIFAQLLAFALLLILAPKSKNKSLIRIKKGIIAIIILSGILLFQTGGGFLLLTIISSIITLVNVNKELKKISQKN